MECRCRTFAYAAIGLAAVLATRPADAAAQEFPMATDRDYALDLYSGNAIGSNEIVSMGGAAVAVARGSAGMLINPAAPAVRSQTSTGKWDWDVHVDWLGAVAGNDFENNGVEDDAATNVAPQVTVGAVGNLRKWALGVGVTFVQFEGASPMGDVLNLSGITAQLELARSFYDDQIIVGVGVRGSDFSVAKDTGEEVFRLASSSIETGAVWAPTNRNLRAGFAASLPATGDQVSVETCDPLNCFGLILPERIEVPWSVTAGVGLRHAATPWNRKVEARFVDERRLIVALDLRLTGAVSDGHGLGQFSRGRLQVSGDRIAVSPRGGGEYEWLPGRLRVRGGSYWEPSRFRDPAGDAVSGRLHITLGADVRIWQFSVFDRTYRLRLSLTFDGAPEYVNSGLSVGFWH